MINFNLDELSLEQIEKKIDDLNNQLLNQDPELSVVYSLDYFLYKSESERKQILEKIGLSDRFDELNLYFLSLDYFREDSIRTNFPGTLNSIKARASSVIIDLNNIVNNRLNEIKLNNEKIKKQIMFYDGLRKYLSGEFSYTKEDYDKLINFIIQSDITPEQKINLSLFLSKKLIDVRKTRVIEVPVIGEQGVRAYSSSEIISFEGDLIEHEEKNSQIQVEENISQYRKDQIEFAEVTYQQYKTFISNSTFCNPEEVYGTFTLDDIRNNELSMDNFAILLNISVSSIKDSSISDEEITEYVNILKNIEQTYQKTVEYEKIIYERNIKKESNKKIIENFKISIQNINMELKRIFNVSGSLGVMLEQNFYDNLIKIQQKIEDITIQIEDLDVEALEGVESIQDNIKDIEISIEEANNNLNDMLWKEKSLKSIKIKTFILFDTNDQSGKTFLYEDMLGDNPFIDQRAIVGNYVSNEDINYQKNISKLIKDLMLYGKCEYMHSINSSFENYGDKIESIIYKTDKNDKVLRDEKTPLWRIRPTPSSNIRFIERKVVIPQNSELLHQVREIILKHLPNAEISLDEDFAMFINFGCGIKRSDNDIYSTAYKRFIDRDVKPLSIFYEDGNYGKHYQKAIKLKNKLSEEECQLLDAYIVNSLQSLYEMSKNEPLYDFSFIDRMGGEKKYGL